MYQLSKLLTATFAMVFIATAPLLSLAGERTVNISMVLICDVYNMTAKNGRGGFARIASAIKAERKRGKHVFVAHAGDTISPSLMSGFDKGEHIIELTNMLKLDAFTPGNHEFDFGEQTFRKRMGEANFPLLAANLRQQDGTKVDGFADTMVLTFDGVKIGVIGLTAENSVSKSSPGSLLLSSSVAAARKYSAELRASGADIIVGLAHAPWQTDVRLMRSGALDVLLSGDDHDLVVYYNGRTVWIESKQEGEYIAAVDLEVKVRGTGDQRQVSWWPKFRIIDTGDVTPDAAVAAKVAAYQEQLSTELDIEIGTTATALDSRKAAVRSGETAIGNLIADAIRSNVNADVALINGGGIRGGRQYDAGHRLTRRDILSELPFANKIVMVEMNGAALRKVLENGVRYLGRANGRFAHLSGAHIVASEKALPGKRLVKVAIGGDALADDKIYRVATNEFIARGREGYDAFKDAKILIGPNDGTLVSNAVMSYIRSAGTVSPKREGRITVQQ